MYGSQQKIRHVNGAGEVRYFTPAVAANKSAMKNGGWFPQEEAHPQTFGTQSSNSTTIEVVIDYKKLLDEKDESITNLSLELNAARELIIELQKQLEVVNTELTAAKSPIKPNKQSKKDNE